MTEPNEPSEHELPQAEPAPTMPGRNRGTLRRGNPGNRGGRGRPSRRIVIRASKNLEVELERLKRMATGAHDVHCPNCGHTFTPPPTARMLTRDRITYTRLLADIKASGRGDDEPPLLIHVTTGPPRERDPVDGTPGDPNSGSAGE